MKKILYSVALLLLAISGTYAQNWECIKTDGEYLYSHAYNSELVIDESIRINNTYNISGYTYYVNHYSIKYESGCYNPFSCSFLGEKIFSNDSNGFYHFINQENDTLHIKSTAGLHERWLFYLNIDKNLQIWAKVDKVLNESFSGITDSVKMITFEAQDLSGQGIYSMINSDFLSLSKHYGFKRIFDFAECPLGIYASNLIGIGPINKGNLNFGLHEIWDIQPGDEFHVYRYYESPAPWSYSYSGTEIIKTLINRWGSYDSILYLKYLVSKREHSSGYGTDRWDSVYPPYIYTEIVNCNQQNYWNTSPNETVIDSTYFNYARTLKIRSSQDSLYQRKEYSEPQFERITDSCYSYGYVYETGERYCVKGAGGGILPFE